MIPVEEIKKTEHYDFICKKFNPFFTRKEFLKRDDIHVLVIRKEEELMAVTMFKDNRKAQEVRLLYTLVDESIRRRGINTAFKEKAEEYARSVNALSLVGHVRETNKASLESLQKIGFHIEHHGELFYDDGERKIRLVKPLQH